jgi:post-segregation antitoxin (ccd killing protein)
MATRCNRHRVYELGIAWLNVYVPDRLAEQAGSRGLNLSALTQAAIYEELERTSASVVRQPANGRSVDRHAATAALDDVHDEIGV